MSFSYDYPRPSVTVDAAVLCRFEEEWMVLLIRRGRPPFEGAWALPGGFIEMDETLLESAARELEEETGLSGVALEQLRTFGDPGRDPRGRTISVVFVGVVDREAAARARAGDDAGALDWRPVFDPPPLAFDHADVLRHVAAWVRRREARHE